MAFNYDKYDEIIHSQITDILNYCQDSKRINEIVKHVKICKMTLGKLSARLVDEGYLQAGYITYEGRLHRSFVTIKKYMSLDSFIASEKQARKDKLTKVKKEPIAKVYLMDDKAGIARHQLNSSIRLTLKKSANNYVSGSTLTMF
jgi:hypothetical protein